MKQTMFFSNILIRNVSILYQLSTDSRNVKIGVTGMALFSIEVGNVINETGNKYIFFEKFH